MSVDTSFPGKPWQNTLVGSRNKLNTLFNDGYISDLTITFPGKEIKYKAHKVILAMSSSIFERMLFGPMAITGSELELPDDNPEAFKIVLAHCYEVSIFPSDIDEALEVYMLADKYFMEELSRECSHYICSMFKSENIEKVLQFSTNFNFHSLKAACYQHFGLKFECDVTDSSEVLLVLRKEWLKELLESGINLPELIFEDSWKYPNETLKDDTIIQILKSQNCRNNGLRKFSGCVTAEVVRNICWDEGIEDNRIVPHLYLSFTNLQQANEIINLLYDIKYTGFLYIHLQCEMIPVERLKNILACPYNPLCAGPDLFLSDVDDNGIDWAVSAIYSLKSLDKSFGTISFPRSKLSLIGFKILLEKMSIIFKSVTYPTIQMCSPKIPSNKENELDKWVTCMLKDEFCNSVMLFDRNEDIDDW